MTNVATRVQLPRHDVSPAAAAKNSAFFRANNSAFLRASLYEALSFRLPSLGRVWGLSYKWGGVRAESPQAQKRERVRVREIEKEGYMEANAAARVKLPRDDVSPVAAAGASSSPGLHVPSDALSFRVPSLRCSFPALLHPEYEVVRDQCEEWILSVAQPPSAAARQFVADNVFPRFVCRVIPNGQLGRLIHVTRIISWLMISDTDDDNPDSLGSDCAVIANRADLILVILRKGNIRQEHEQCRLQGDYSPSESKARSKGLEALADVWEQACKDMPIRLRTRFTATMADYLDSVKAQTAYRSARSLPDMDAYLALRRNTSFMLPLFALMEYALGIELDEATYFNPLIAQLRNAAIDYICFCNDLVSCRVEIAVGDNFNLPSILYNTAGSAYTTFQDAVDHAARMTEDVDARCVHLVAAIENSTDPALQQPCVRTYMAALSFCMSGNLAWSFETARYRQSCTCEGLVIDLAIAT